MKAALALIALIALVGVQAEILSNGWNADIVVRGDRTGRLSFIAGDLGKLTQDTPRALMGYVNGHVSSLLGVSADQSTFRLRKTEVDMAGHKHYFLQQTHRGLEVDGGEVIVHVNATGTEVFALTCSVLLDIDVAEEFERGISAPYNPVDAIRNVAPVQNYTIVEGSVSSLFVVHNEISYYAYRAEISFFDEDDVERKSIVFAEVDDGTPIAEFPLFMPALSRIIYNTRNTNSLPGTKVRTEGQGPSSDKVINQAYDNSGNCYNFYKATFNRDSYNGRGAAMQSTVHYGVGYNNAFWNGQQMVYGDGDGKVFNDFAQDLSVVCHELTHAVTQYSANLRYSGESGALNEAMSDIMGASSTAYVGGKVTSSTWLIGAQCYLQGAALRYMNNPTLDGSSRDYYPERYTGILDNGGVHWNSGIANLAYYLFVSGGQHPRKKTTIMVTGQGIAKGQQVFYSMLTNYMTTTSNFAAAKGFAITAAKALGYSTSVQQTASDCFTAVGVN